MEKKFLIFGCLAALLLSAVPQHSAFASCPGDALEVEIEGNEKTRPEVVRRLAGLKGKCVPPKGINPKKVKQKLLKHRQKKKLPLLCKYFLYFLFMGTLHSVSLFFFYTNY